jgi:alkylhydroperoxidase family enzyme
MVEEVGLRRMPVAVAVASLTAVARAARGLANGDAAAAALTVSRYRAAAQCLASRQSGRKRLEVDSGLPSQRDLEGDPPMPRVKSEELTTMRIQ